jgi:hypothetical protein
MTELLEVLMFEGLPDEWQGAGSFVSFPVHDLCFLSFCSIVTNECMTNWRLFFAFLLLCNSPSMAVVVVK